MPWSSGQGAARWYFWGESASRCVATRASSSGVGVSRRTRPRRASAERRSCQPEPFGIDDGDVGLLAQGRALAAANERDAALETDLCSGRDVVRLCAQAHAVALQKVAVQRTDVFTSRGAHEYRCCGIDEHELYSLACVELKCPTGVARGPIHAERGAGRPGSILDGNTGLAGER